MAEAEPKKINNETRSKVADKIGMKKTTYTKVKKVWDTAKAGDTYAKSLVDKLDKEDVSANEASKRIKVYQEDPEPIKKKIIKEDLTAKEPKTKKIIFQNVFLGFLRSFDSPTCQDCSFVHHSFSVLP